MKIFYHKSDLKTSSKAAVVRGKKSSWYVKVKHGKLVHTTKKLINKNNNRILSQAETVIILVLRSTHSCNCRNFSKHYFHKSLYFSGSTSIFLSFLPNKFCIANCMSIHSQIIITALIIQNQYITLREYDHPNN